MKEKIYKVKNPKLPGPAADGGGPSKLPGLAPPCLTAGQGLDAGGGAVWVTRQ